MSLLVTEDATPEPATTVMPLVARQCVAATRRIKILTKLTGCVVPDTVGPILATGRSVASTSSTTVLVVVRAMSTFAPAFGILTEAGYGVFPL